LFARLPNRPWTSAEIRQIASRLVELLPAAPTAGKNDQVISATNAKPNPIVSRHLIYCALALSGALVFGLIAHGNDGHEAAPAVSQAPTPSAPMQ
jgi:hypothetical protein